jgi:hypothetical protein
MQENNSFISFDNTQIGLLFDDSKHPQYPIRYYNVVDTQGFEFKDDCSYYGFAYSGRNVLIRKDGKAPICIQNGMYFSLSDWFRPTVQLHDEKPESGKMIIIEVLHTKGDYPKTNYKAAPSFGGPIEPTGRLKYIDGCTDSLLIAPVKMGDPCFNHLHFPKNITQTPHTHPTHRIGIVARGNGECITPFGNLPLTEGMIFIIKEWNGESYKKGLDGEMYPVGTHKFDTKEESMDVIAFHPDSDFGATDINHPMINRTIVDGVRASLLDDIRTK